MPAEWKRCRFQGTVKSVIVDFEELDYQPTPMGELSLRRRIDPLLGVEVFEVKLGDEFLMSSLFTRAEIALAELGLAGLGDGSLDVVVGGLGLGYTAAAVLDRPQVCSLLVVEALAPVIDWHRRGLLPLGRRLDADPRCRMVQGDFFALARNPKTGFDPASPGRRFHAVFLDIDHAPDHWLHPSHGGFYRAEGLGRLADHLHPGGVFALWSNDPPDPGFMEVLSGVFAGAEARLVRFPNPYQDSDSVNTVYCAGKGA